MTQKELNLKEWGLEASSRPHQREIEVCRNWARKIIRERGEVTIDDLRESLPHFQWGNWSGSIFHSKEFESIGFKPATHKGSHGRIVRRWTLKKP